MLNINIRMSTFHAIVLFFGTFLVAFPVYLVNSSNKFLEFKQFSLPFFIILSVVYSFILFLSIFFGGKLIALVINELAKQYERKKWFDFDRRLTEILKQDGLMYANHLKIQELNLKDQEKKKFYARSVDSIYRQLFFPELFYKNIKNDLDGLPKGKKLKNIYFNEK